MAQSFRVQALPRDLHSIKADELTQVMDQIEIASCPIRVVQNLYFAWRPINGSVTLQ